MIRLIHIAPELPPTIGGVADYTTILSRRLVKVSEVEVEPVLVHVGKERVETIDVEFPVVDQSGDQSAAGLANTVQQLSDDADERAVVLLEYSGYGYATRGAPLWLARGLRQVCGQDGVPLITMFHELYATSWRPWTSSFWVSPLQWFVALRLARMSTGIVTNRRSAVPWLRKHRKSDDIPVSVQPVFSNVGEPETRSGSEARDRRAVMFGGGGRKAVIYNEHQDVLRRLVREEEFSGVLDIGPVKEKALPSAKWYQALGICPVEEISEQLASASLGILSYSGRRLGKSGVAAAFAAHGVPFLLFDEEESAGNTDPYVEGEHFWRIDTAGNLRSRLPEERLAGMSRAIWSLYQKHLHSTRSACNLLDLIQSVTGVSLSVEATPTH